MPTNVNKCWQMSATNVAQMSTDEALLVLQFLQSPAKRSYTVAVAIRSYIPHLICSLRPAIHVQSDLSVDESAFRNYAGVDDGPAAQQIILGYVEKKWLPQQF